jgi:hypothetical protein
MIADLPIARSRPPSMVRMANLLHKGTSPRSV